MAESKGEVQCSQA